MKNIAVNKLRVGYVPISEDFESPGDTRRFIFYSKERNISVEIADVNCSYDCVVLSQAADLSIWRNYKKSPIVFDFIDSYYALPKLNLRAMMRGLAKFLARKSTYLQLNYWAALEDMCKHSAAVVCATDEQKQVLSSFNKNIHVILDAHNFFIHRPKSIYNNSFPLKLIWEGLPQNIKSLKVIKNVLNPLLVNGEVELHVISDPQYYSVLNKYILVNSVEEVKKIVPQAKFHVWKKSSLANLITNCDIAIIPIDIKNPLTAGKPENKLLLFWRMGMPVITTNTSAYKKAMLSSGHDFTCSNESEWNTKLQLLMRNQNLRQEVANAGFKVSQLQYSISNIVSQWDAMFESLNLKDFKLRLKRKDL